ncbi:hypothetical protein E4U41_002001 [Claviceps citrina]|nr:hypothetical protein E4U41_002001 [Claviceps citrina]
MNEMRPGLLKLLENKSYVDYEIACNGESIPVHKVMLCAASPVFHAACSTSYKRRPDRLLKHQEANGTYTIDDFSPSEVRYMVEYIYSGSYKEEDTGADDYEAVARLHLTMFAIGDRYIIDGLKGCALRKLDAMLRRRRGIDVAVFLDCVREVYATTPSTQSALRSLVVHRAACEYGECLVSPETKPLFNSLTSECPDFKNDLLQYLIVVGNFCPKCPRQFDDDYREEGRPYLRPRHVFAAGECVYYVGPPRR